MTAFDLRCRQPGTRCAAIMDMIDQGMSDEEIAAIYNNEPKMPCSPEDIAVYRKAHDGTLTPPAGMPYHVDDKEERDATMLALYQMGSSADDLRCIFGLAKSSILKILRKQRKKKNRV